MRELIYKIHDQDCNQKYAETLPYSFHLKCVEAQGEKFIHLIDKGVIRNDENYRARVTYYKDLVRMALASHDIIEDGRMSYNDVTRIGTSYFENSVAGEMLAEIVYCVTDEKGRNRKERKSDKYYKELSKNKLAVFVKLADISANTLFSKMTGGSMYEKYKQEFNQFKQECYIEEYKEFFDYLQKL